MTDVHLRARVLLAEAESLGVGLADLVAVGDVSTIPTLATYIETIAPTFAAATAATYWPDWRLAIARHGDRPIAPRHHCLRPRPEPIPRRRQPGRPRTGLGGRRRRSLRRPWHRRLGEASHRAASTHHHLTGNARVTRE